MKKKYIISLFIIILFLSFLSYSFVSSDENKKTKTYSTKSWYDLYKERVVNFCSEYKYNDKYSDTIYLLDEKKYFTNLDQRSSTAKLSPENFVLTARNDFRKNMNHIYECATLASSNRSIKVLEYSIKGNAKLMNELMPKLKKIEWELKSRAKSMEGKCKVTGSKKNNLIKKSILRQTTYELCKYNYYLEYLREYYGLVENITSLNGESKYISIKDANDTNYQQSKMIDNLIKNAYETQPVVLAAYSDYENNLGPHILLDLLEKDYKTLRDELHKVLTPLNQVGYKIKNATRGQKQ